MRKKVSLFFIVVLLVVLAMSMIACDKSSQNGGDLPEEINPSDVVEGKDDSENATVTSSLKFSFPEGASSVFKSLFTDEFDISAVEYCVIYTNVDTKTTTEGKRGNLSVGMIEKITDSTVKNDDGTLNVPAGSSWVFQSSGDLDMTPFAGQSVYIAFRYTTSGGVSGTWEIKNVLLYEPETAE